MSPTSSSAAGQHSELLLDFWQSASDIFLALDARLQLIWANDAARQLLPRSPDSLMHQSLWVALPNYFSSNLQIACETALRVQRSIGIEEFISTTKQWYSVRVIPSKPGLLLRFENISERKELQHARDITNQRFEAIVQGMSEGLLVADAAGNILTMNQAAQAMFQFSGLDQARRNLAAYRGIFLIHSLEDQLIALEDWPVSRAIRGESFADLRCRVIRTDTGKVWYASFGGNQVYDEDHRLLYAVVTVRDITNQHLRDAALRDSEEFNRRLIDSSVDSLKVLDLGGKLLLMSKGGQQLLEITDPRPYMGRPWIELWKPEDRPTALAAIAAANAGQTGRFQAPRPTAKGKLTWWDVQVTPICDAQGHPKQLLAIARDITAQKKSETELREAHQRLQYHVQNTPLAVIEFDAELRVKIWSDGARRVFGWEAGEVLGRYMWEIPWIHPDDRDKVQAISAALCDGSVLRSISPNRNLRKDGSVAWCEWYNSSLTDESGKMQSIQSLVLDVTARREAEESLKTSLRRLEILANTAGALLEAPEPQKVIDALCQQVMTHLDCQVFFNFLADPGSRRLHLNACGGISPQQASAIEWLDYDTAICGCVARDRCRIVAERIPSTPDPRTDLVRSYGVRAYACHPLLGPGGELLGTLSFGTCTRELFNEADLSLMKAVADHVAVALARLLADEALREGKQHLAEQLRLLDMSNDAIIVRDPEDRVTYWNKGAAETYGYSAEEAVGQVTHDLLRTEHPEPLERIRETLLRDGRWSGRLVHWRRDSRKVIVSSRWVLDRDVHGYPASILETNTDITEATRAEQALAAAKLSAERAKEAAEAASRAKDQFLAVLSHELRTPLTPVATVVQLMQANDELPPELREQIAMVARNVGLEIRLIDDLLDMTRIARSKLVLELAQVDLHRVIQQSAEIVHADIRSKGQSFLLKLHATHAIVRGDAARLQQIIWNLLKNSTKFTPAGGLITIQTRNLPNQLIEVCIIDSGIGIDPQVLPHIFDAFEQGSSDITRQFGGLGLGLAISKSLADLHGGTLVAQSEGKGKGCNFTLTLPTVAAIPADDPPSTGTLAADPQTASIPLRVLLVEDHSDTARVMRQVLTGLSCEVRHADTVASALRCFDAESFDLVICDLGLPDGNGYDLMRQLRQKRTVRGIAVSGYGMEDDIRRSRESGFDEHLTKPVSIATLRQAIARAAAART